MKLQSLLAASVVGVLAAMPLTANAMCAGQAHQETASNCQAGQVWDKSAQTCVDTMG